MWWSLLTMNSANGLKLASFSSSYLTCSSPYSWITRNFRLLSIFPGSRKCLVFSFDPFKFFVAIRPSPFPNFAEAPRVGLGNTEPEPKSSKEALSPWGQARVYMSLLSLHFPIVFSPVLDLVFHLIGSSFECIFGPKSIAQFSFTVHSCKALRVELNVPRQCHRQSRKSHI